MRTRINYKTFPMETASNFDGTAITTQQGAGKFNFDSLEQQAEACGLGGLVCPVFGLSYNSPTVPRESVLLYLRNPRNDDIRKLIFFRDVADGDPPTQDFIEDNLGEGWPVPYVDGNGGDRFELILVTTGDVQPAYATLEIWFEPTPNLKVYKSMIEAAYGLQPGA